MWRLLTRRIPVRQWIVMAALCASVQAQEPVVPPPVPVPPSAVVSVIVIDGKTMPGDFLNILGQQTKALWRKLYRDPPPTPSTDRSKVAFMLGVLIADSHLKLQAGDAQKFRDNNQDLLAYCKVLGLSEKITPEVMAEGKMAETEDWNGLKGKVNELRRLIVQLLKDQRDEDLSILVDLGMWMRLLEISSSLVLNDPEMSNKTLCIGSALLLNDMIANFERLTEATRMDPLVTHFGKTLQHLQRYWTNAQEPLSLDQVQMSSDKITHIVSKIAQ